MLAQPEPQAGRRVGYGHEGQIGAESYEEYLERLNTVWSECYRVAKPNAIFALNVGNRRVKKRYHPIGMDIAASIKGWELWDHARVPRCCLP